MLIILFQLGVSVVYELLPDRKAITYTYYSMFCLPQQNNFIKLDPQLIMTDFELTIEEAIGLEIYVSSMLSTAFG